MFYLSNLQINVIVAGCLVLLLLIILFVVFRVIRSRVKKNVKDFKNKVSDFNEYVRDTIASLVTRFYFISQSNEEYERHFIYFSDKRDEIVNQYEDELNKMIDLLNEYSDKNNRKMIIATLSEANVVFSSYKKDISILEGEMDEFLSQDDECHSFAVPFQQKYRELKNLYLSNKEALSVISYSIDSLFSKIEVVFDDFEKLAGSAHYVDAKARIITLEPVFEALSKALVDLPPLCVKLKLIIPKKIEELKALQSELEEKQFPLHHLRVKVTISEIEIHLAEIEKRLNSFKYKRVDEYLKEIENRIESIIDSFQVEISAKEYFDDNCENFYQKASQVVDQFLKIKRSIPKYKKIYEIKESCFEMLVDLENEITILGNTRRELDNYIHSSSRQPYSLLQKKLDDLNMKTMNILNRIGEISSYLKSLKDDSDAAYKLLSPTFISLKQLELDVSEIGVSVYEESLKNDFKTAYNALDNIGMLIKITPINVEAINLSVNRVLELENKIKTSLSNNKEVALDAENSIVYANRFRMDFFDLRQTLIGAEENFFIGNFSRSFDSAVSAIKQVKKM